MEKLKKKEALEYKNKSNKIDEIKLRTCQKLYTQVRKRWRKDGSERRKERVGQANSNSPAI